MMKKKMFLFPTLVFPFFFLLPGQKRYNKPFLTGLKHLTCNEASTNIGCGAFAARARVVGDRFRS
jgi:hypothetical protein